MGKKKSLIGWLFNDEKYGTDFDFPRFVCRNYYHNTPDVVDVGFITRYKKDASGERPPKKVRITIEEID